MPKGNTEHPNDYATAENKKIFDEYKRTGIKPTHLFCYKCSKPKLLSEMVKNSKKDIGVITLCSECNREKTRQYKEQFRDQINKKSRDKHATPEYKEASWNEYLAKLPEPLRKNKILKKECEEAGKTPTHKHCNKCGELLSLDSYAVTRDKEAIFGRTSICRTCQKKKRDGLPDDAVVEMEIDTAHNIKVRDENNILKNMYEEQGIEPTYKICNTCEKMLEIDKFNINERTLFGRCGRCIDCDKEYKSEYNIKNNDRLKKQKKEKYNKIKNTPEYKERSKINYIKGRVKRNLRQKIRMQTDPEYAIKHRIRTSLRRFLKGGKTKTSKEYGIDFDAIQLHLGQCPGETKDYHIDHIIPCDAFDFTNEEHIKLCYHPSNLRWFINKLNMAKGGKIIPKLINHFNLSWICDEIKLDLTEHVEMDVYFEEFK